MIRPIPEQHGVGFFSMERLPEYADKYREVQAGRYWNYFVTPDNYGWPETAKMRGPYVIDGFSPNLNKPLHVGHLRQLALANGLWHMLRDRPYKVKFVALLGASLGVLKVHADALQEWFKFVDYQPELYYDVLMPKDADIVPRRKEEDIALASQGAEVWDGPKGPVIVVRTDGRSTYAFHDIAFAATVKPTHYITGAEQKEHFEALGLGDKHLPMGLVLGPDNKKMKSRTGDSVSAEEVMTQIVEQLDPTPEPRKLAWNVLAWNFLHVARNQNVKYNPQEWTKPDAPGMYITYTYARLKSALKSVDEELQVKVAEEWDMTQEDANVLGFADQFHYYWSRSVDALDPAQLANFTHDLARKLSVAYHSEKIQGGRTGFQFAMLEATDVLQRCMWSLGLFPLEKV